MAFSSYFSNDLKRTRYFLFKSVRAQRFKWTSVNDGGGNVSAWGKRVGVSAYRRVGVFVKRRGGKRG
jgi:hypothetical protein